MTPENRMREHLAFLYGPERAARLFPQLQAMLGQFQERTRQIATNRGGLVRPSPSSEKDVILITYGDQVQEPGATPLQSLAEVLEAFVQDAISSVHILPFFPYSSDDGFSVIDYMAVNPQLGTWTDIERLGQNYRLMFDAVVNHVSAQSDWFQEFLRGNPAFTNYFITVEEGTDLSQVVRPRALPLLTPVQTARGERLVWTTFSPDQIDLNFAHPEVLLRIIEILLFYVERGAQIIRLDAIAYLWKKIGTSCIHLEETHRVVKLLRAILDAVAPQVTIITETNVPHQENMSYLGNGTDEAHMVYQFSLPPLVLHAFLAGDATHLTEWAAGLSTSSKHTTFFNFLASHDGIGVRPAEGILSPEELEGLVEQTRAHGGYVSYKAEADGNQTAYELNISYFDALSDPHASEPLDLQVGRFLAAQAILLSLAGVPGIYVHSLFGSRSNHAGVEKSSQYRSVNRQKFRRDDLERALLDSTSLRSRVFYPCLHIIRTRTAQAAFHPSGGQQVLPLHPAVFAFLRSAPDESQIILCLHNVSNAEQTLQFDLGELFSAPLRSIQDLITGTTYPVNSTNELALRLAPYQVLWLTGAA